MVIFSFIPSIIGTRPISVPSTLLRGFYLVLVSVRLGMTFNSLKIPFTHLVWWVGCFGYLGSENANPAGSGENASSPHSTLGVVQKQKSKRVYNPTWRVGSLKGLEVSYENSHVLFVFMLNSSLHFAKL